MPTEAWSGTGILIKSHRWFRHGGMIGGLVTATLLVLFVLPVLYSVVSKKKA